MTHARPRARRTTALAAAAVAVLALAGCNDGDDHPAKESRPSHDSSSAVSATPPSPAAGVPTPEVTVLDEGAAPRRTLELDVHEGHIESSTMRTTMTSTIDIMSRPPIEVPMEMPLTTKVTDVTDDRITVESTFGEVTVPAGTGLDAASRAQIRRTVRVLDGTTMLLAFDRSGRSISSEVEYGTRGRSPMVEQLLDDFVAQSGNLTVPFPTQDVGLGARWRADTSATVGGVTSDVSTTYRLTALSYDGYTVAVAVRQRVRPGKVAGGEVRRGSTTATGTSSGRRGMVLPVRAGSTGHGFVAMVVGGQPIRTTIDVTLELTTR